MVALEHGAHVRRGRPAGHERLERHPSPGRRVRGRRAGRPLPQHRSGRGVAARRGPDGASQPRLVGAGCRRPHPPHHRAAPGGSRAHVDRHQLRRRLRDTRRRRDVDDAEPRAPGVLRARPLPGDRALRPQDGARGRRDRPSLPAAPLRGLPVGRRRRDLGGSERRPPVGLRVRDGRPSARSAHRLRDPADGRFGMAHGRRSRRGLDDAGRRGHLARPARRPAAGARISRRPSRSDGHRPARSRRRLLRDEHRAALRERGRGESWRHIADLLPPIWSVDVAVVED